MDASDSEMEEHRQEENRHLQIPVNVPVHHNSITPWNSEHHGVTTLYRCDANDARSLYIFDSAEKLLKSDQYDIGGANTDNGGFWFYFTTTRAPTSNLMNIFVFQRSPGSFSLGISNSNILTSTIYNDHKVRKLSNQLEWQNFNSTVPDEVHHIKTFCFSEQDRLSLTKMILIIPISINVRSKSKLNNNLVQKIKGEHEFGEKLFKDLEPDFVIISGEGKSFKVHKIVLAAHSPVLREMVRANECKSLDLNITNGEMQLLLQFLYTGTIEDILNQPFEILLIMANKFQLLNLVQLVKHAMKLSICSENVLDVAVLAETYNCKDVQEVAFKYIGHHPEILNTEAFSQINNANVVKELLRYIHLKP